MRVLIGCEKSGVTRRAFHSIGIEAWSCDIEPSEDDSPFHIQDDILNHLGDGWDMMIAHPECTKLCSSGLHWNSRTPGRAAETWAAIQFVEKLWDAPIKKICIENSIGCLPTFSKLMKASQIISPNQFGHDASKDTCLWLRKLPLLVPTKIIPGRLVEWPRGSGKMVERWANQTDSGQNNLSPSDDRSALRARTYDGIADAFAIQWGLV